MNTIINDCFIMSNCSRKIRIKSKYDKTVLKVGNLKKQNQSSSFIVQNT